MKLKEEIFSCDNMDNMESMHDSVVKDINLENNTLIISYDDLHDILNYEGMPYYKHNKLTIKYFFSSHCDAIVFGKKKYAYLELTQFLSKYKNYKYISYKIAIDNFKELKLILIIRNYKKEKCCKTKWHLMHIELDPSKIIYEWTD